MQSIPELHEKAATEPEHLHRHGHFLLQVQSSLFCLFFYNSLLIRTVRESSRTCLSLVFIRPFEREEQPHRRALQGCSVCRKPSGTRPGKQLPRGPVPAGGRGWKVTRSTSMPPLKPGSPQPGSAARSPHSLAARWDTSLSKQQPLCAQRWDETPWAVCATPQNVVGTDMHCTPMSKAGREGRLVLYKICPQALLCTPKQHAHTSCPCKRTHRE